MSENNRTTIAVERFKSVLDDVLETERSNTRSPDMDYRARVFFRDHGEALLEALASAETRGVS